MTQCWRTFMIFTKTIELDTNNMDDLNEIGEMMRSKFFGHYDPIKQIGKGLGCYSNFEFEDGIEEHLLKPDQYPDFLDFLKDCPAIKVVYGEHKEDDIRCWWFWEGDGFLMFELPDGTIIENCDCKKTTCWQYGGR